MSHQDRLKDALAQHPLYRRIRSLDDLRMFMENHVFAVWDFMALAKRLQQELTCVTVPWVPASDPIYTRLINEIILDEESDEDGQGGYASHFALYLSAMVETGAHTKPIRQFVAKVAQGTDPLVAIQSPDIPHAARQFVEQTLQIAREAPVHQVVSAFFYGREDLIPAMFSAMVKHWQLEGHPVNGFVYYLDRHIAVDGERHGPMVHRLLENLSVANPSWQNEIDRVAVTVMTHRRDFWDAIVDQLESVPS